MPAKRSILKLQESKLFNKVQSLVESGDLSQELAESLDSEISLALSDLRKEAQSYREKNAELTESFNSVQTSQQNLQSQLTDVDARIKTARQEGKSEVVIELERQKQQHQDLSDQLKTFSAENTKLKVSNQISKSLTGFNVKSDIANDVQTMLSSMVDYKDGNITLDGQPLEEGIKTFFNARKSLLEPIGNAYGSGATAGQSGSASITRADFEKLPPSEQAKAAATKEITN